MATLPGETSSTTKTRADGKHGEKHGDETLAPGTPALWETLVDFM